MLQTARIQGPARLFRFIGFGFVFAIPGEILNQLLSRRDPSGFRNTLFSYFILLLIGYFAGQGLRRAIKCRATAALLFYVLFGSLGLMVEWFLLGNAPVADWMQLVAQPGMFSFWGTMLLGPWILMESSEFAALKRGFLIFYSAVSVVYLTVALVVPRQNGGIYFGFIIFAAGSAALNVFYVRYFKQLRRTSKGEAQPSKSTG
jgi:hypothetical protein